MPHIRRLFDTLLNTLTILQVEAQACDASGVKRKISKALAVNPFGVVNVEEVATVPLRLLRINSTSNPKQARADKRLYDDLIQKQLAELHCLAWKILEFLFGNVEMGTEVFERELAALVRDQIKSDLKTAEAIGKGSECALNHFNKLIKSSTSWNGQVYICEIISSGILVEISSKSLRKLAVMLRSGPNTEKIQSGSGGNKKARYHEASESDQKRLEIAQMAFVDELDTVFFSLLSTFGVFESSQGHLNPQDHVILAENVLTAMALLFQSQSNYKSFVKKINEGDYLCQLVKVLSFALVSFQPAYLPPFLPLALRFLSSISGKSDTAGLAARRALLQVELMVHPRRSGPIVYRPASEAVKKVFERPKPVIEETEMIVVEKSSEGSKEPESENMNNVEIKEEKIPDSEKPIYISVPQINHNAPVETVDTVSVSVTSTSETVPVKVTESSTVVPLKRPNFNDDDDDDEPLPQIVDSGPDDN